MNVPKKANDALHLSLLEGCDLSHEALGEVVLQESFQVWDPKNVIIRKAKDRHIFLFELYLVFSKEIKDSNGKSKYIYKSRLLVSMKKLKKNPYGYAKEKSWMVILNKLRLLISK